MKLFFKKYNIYISLILVLVITFFIYYSGLMGDYVFDDSANILENKKLAITTLDWNSLKSAFWSGGAGPLGRPVSMLSFAFNHYFTGFNPYYFKLTNLFIHLINGVLVYLLSLFIFQKLDFKSQLKKELIPYYALATSFIWLIHPINLTSVLYVVQRMTSLSTLFGLLMLVIYCYWRNQCHKPPKFTILCLAGMFFSFLASIFSKESGILFVGLLYWIELLIFQGKNIFQKDIYIGKIKLIYALWFGVVLGIISIIIISLPFIFNGDLGSRNFNTIERLFTESRVIFYYLKMIFFPLLSDLSLYHDDFIISKSIIQPITTLYSLVAILFTTLISFLLVKRFPLLLFAWGWYLISQLLESTFISLELVHEHRNYFGTIGFIICFVYLFAQINNKKIKVISLIAICFYITNLAFTTWQRALLWSNLVDQAAYEVSMHEKSDRANYQMARIYMKLMNEIPLNREEYAKKAYYYLEQAKKSYLPSNGAWFGELHLASEMGWGIASQTVDELKARLAHLPFTNNNIGFLSAFVDCQIKGFCKVSHEQAVLIIAAGIDNPNVNNNVRSELFKLLANYFVSVIADYTKGEEFMSEALKLKNDVNGRLVFAQIFRLQNKLIQAEAQLQQAKQLDTNNIWIKEIEIEQYNIMLSKQKFGHGY